MRRGVVAAVKSFLVGLLFAVIGKRLAGNLPSAESASVGERGEENRVERAALLKNVEHLIDTFIDERNSADLDADHFLWGRFLGCIYRRRKRGRNSQGCGSASAVLEEFAACEFEGRVGCFHRAMRTFGCCVIVS